MACDSPTKMQARRAVAVRMSAVRGSGISIWPGACILSQVPLQTFHKSFIASKWSRLTSVVAGGARGLGLCMVEVLVEAGVLFHLLAVSRPFSLASVFLTLKLHVSLRNHLVYCLDRLPEPDDSFAEARRRVLPEFGGELHYAQIDVRDNKSLDSVITGIAEKYERLDGLIAGTSSIPPFNPQTTSLCPAQTPPSHQPFFMDRFRIRPLPPNQPIRPRPGNLN